MNPTELGAVLDRFLEVAQRIRKRRVLAPLERKLEGAWRSSFRREAHEFMRKFAALESMFDATEAVGGGSLIDSPVMFYLVEGVTDATRAAQAASRAQDAARRAATLDVMVQSMGAGAASAYADLQLQGTFDLANPRAVAWLRDHVAELLRGVTAETRDRVGAIVVNAVQIGQSYTKTATQLRALYSGFGKMRAHTIAVTETAFGYEHGNRLFANSLLSAGHRMQKYWITVGDDRVCEQCEGNAADGQIPMGQGHTDGSDQPPGHPLCRCTEGYEVIT